MGDGSHVHFGMTYSVGIFLSKRPLSRFFLLRLAVDKEASMDSYWSLKMTEVGVGILSFLSCYRTGN